MGPIVQILDPPLGMYPARLDDRGRLKLPTGFQTYFSGLPERKLYCTSINRRTAQVYPISEWRTNLKMLQEQRDNAGAARKVLFNAADLGSESEMDGQGRILFSPELRRALDIENQGVHVYAYRGRLEVLPDPVYKQMQEESATISADEITGLEKEGLR